MKAKKAYVDHYLPRKSMSASSIKIFLSVLAIMAMAFLPDASYSETLRALSGQMIFPQGIIDWKIINDKKQTSYVMTLSMIFKSKKLVFKIPTESGNSPIWKDIDQDGIADLLVPSVIQTNRFTGDIVILMPQLKNQIPRVLLGELLPLNQSNQIIVEVENDKELKQVKASLLVNFSLGMNSIWEIESHSYEWYVIRCSSIIDAKIKPVITLKVEANDGYEMDFTKLTCQDWNGIPNAVFFPKE